MRAKEKNEQDTNHMNAMYSIVKGHHQADPKVVETFNRPPYAPVMNFERGEVNRERKTESEEV